MKHFFITTPIYYVNDKPHIGHYYCNVMADAAARWHRLKNEKVFFITGTDENTQKVLPVAERENMDPKKFVDKMTERWIQTWKELGISHDKFIRTTSPEHHKAAKEIFKRAYAAGDIYKKKYSGLYCVGCEKFYKESELKDGLCPDHLIKPTLVEEENYFFKLSRYQDKILKLLESNDFAFPESRKNEMISFVKFGLEDISISRINQGWGIPVPDDPSQVLYVWFDALINYLTGLGFASDNDKTSDFWAESVHLVGKDIFRFHTVLWPAMLMSAGLPPPKKVFGHGFFTVNGQKISKSLGNAIDPLELSKKYGIDTLRFYMLFDIPFGQDADFSEKRLEEIYNSFLVNDYGNLLSRVLNMIERFSDGKCIKPSSFNEFSNLIESLNNLCKEVIELYDYLKFEEILKKLFKVISIANTLIDEEKPWQLAKLEKKDRLDALLYVLFETLRITTFILHPVMPSKTREAFNQMGFDKAPDNVKFEEWIKFGLTETGHRISKKEHLFPRREPPVSDTVEQKVSIKNETEENIISIDDFKKVELVVAEVREAQRLPNSDKLLKLKIVTGDSERTILAGIAQHYSPESLIGKKIIVVKNLKPRKIRNEVSEGMLLAASSSDTISILTVEKDIPAGSKIS